MVTRNTLLVVEKAVQRLISACQEGRRNETENDEGYALLVALESEAHEMTKRISNLTEGKLKEVVHVAFRDEGGITPARFEACVGRPPENDDLERANCKRAGEPGHYMCGWCWKCDKPRFICGCDITK